MKIAREPLDGVAARLAARLAGRPVGAGTPSPTIARKLTSLTDSAAPTPARLRTATAVSTRCVRPASADSIRTPSLRSSGLPKSSAPSATAVSAASTGRRASAAQATSALAAASRAT